MYQLRASSRYSPSEVMCFAHLAFLRLSSQTGSLYPYQVKRTVNTLAILRLPTSDTHYLLTIPSPVPQFGVSDPMP